MSKLRSISTSFWSDPFIEDLSPEEKLLFIYLVTNEKTNMLGIYEASISKMAFETGIEKEMVLKALEGFERLNKVSYQNNYVILTNYLKHQKFNTNMMKSAIDAYNELPNNLKIKGLKVSKDNPSEGFERLSKGYGMVRKVEVEYEVEVEDESEGEIGSIPLQGGNLFLDCCNKVREIEPDHILEGDESANLKIIIKKIKTQITQGEISNTGACTRKIEDKEILEAFGYLIENLPQWFKERFSLELINKKYSSIISELRNGNKKKPSGLSKEYLEKIFS